MRVGLIGFGGMGRVVCRELLGHKSEAKIEIVGVIVSADDYQQAKQENELDIPLLDGFQSLLDQEPDVIAECAGHEAVRQYGNDVLAAGIDLVIISTGVLAEQALYQQLGETARLNDSCVFSCRRGAVGGIDALTAARIAGLHKVTYRGRKTGKRLARNFG